MSWFFVQNFCNLDKLITAKINKTIALPTKYYFVILFLSGISLNSYAALSATTVKSISGTKPYIAFNGTPVTNLDNLLSFNMPDGVGGTITIEPTIENSVITVDSSYTFSQFVTKVIADGTSKNLSTVTGVTYYDVDGDAAHTVTPVNGTLKAIWSY